MHLGVDESDSIWTAGTDSINEGIWEWNWDNAWIDYTNWDVGQPGNILVLYTSTLISFYE